MTRAIQEALHSLDFVDVQSVFPQSMVDAISGECTNRRCEWL